MARLANFHSIADLRRAAKSRAHKMVFDYIDGGADDEKTLRRSSAAFDDYVLSHRVLAGVDKPDTSIKLLGQTLEQPYFFSPAAGQRLFHKVGERAAATVAKEVGTAFCLSTLSSVSIEDVAAIGPEALWFQLYVWKDRGLVSEMISRAKESGFKALLLTVDFPITGNRERDLRNGFTIPPKTGIKQAIEALRHPVWTLDYLLSPPIKYANLDRNTPAVSLNAFVAEQLSPTFNWKDAEWLLGEWNGPSVLKGVVHPEDAALAKDTGFDCVMVSNHGGRQLDGDISPLDALPRIVDRVSGDMEIVLDGGVRRGSDILKAMALGADAVSFARPYLYGLAAGGIEGVRRAAHILSGELERDMILAGWANLEDAKERLILQY